MLYFAYGMNTNLLEMQSRCPAARSLGPALLVDHDFRFAVHADVVPERGSVVHGVLWDITDECLWSLDLLEGYPHYYTRDSRPVIYRGELWYAQVYFMTPGHETAPPHRFYYETVRQGYLEHGVPVDQLDRHHVHTTVA